MCMKPIKRKWYRRLYIWFRRKIKWHIKREIWLVDVPLEYEMERHSSHMHLGYVEHLCHLFKIGEYADFMDDTDWFELVKIAAYSGYNMRDIDLLHKYNWDEKETIPQCILFPRRILEEVAHTPDNMCYTVRFDDTPGEVPETIIIHYGKGEIPFWADPIWIAQQVDQDYFDCLKKGDPV